MFLCEHNKRAYYFLWTEPINNTREVDGQRYHWYGTLYWRQDGTVVNSWLRWYRLSIWCCHGNRVCIRTIRITAGVGWHGARQRVVSVTQLCRRVAVRIIHVIRIIVRHWRGFRLRLVGSGGRRSTNGEVVATDLRLIVMPTATQLITRHELMSQRMSRRRLHAGRQPLRFSRRRFNQSDDTLGGVGTDFFVCQTKHAATTVSISSKLEMWCLETTKLVLGQF